MQGKYAQFFSEMFNSFNGVFLSFFSKCGKVSYKYPTNHSYSLHSYNLSLKYCVSQVKPINLYGKIFNDHVFNACIVMNIADVTRLRR